MERRIAWRTRGGHGLIRRVSVEPLRRVHVGAADGIMERPVQRPTMPDPRPASADACRIEIATGPEATAHLARIAALRMAVFREWPYLYAGDEAYEREYLAAYAASPRSVFVLALAGDEVVGVATGVPLADEAPAFRAPFEQHGPDPAQVFYFGESVLLPEWRGQGVGHAFFDGREAHARALGGFAWTAFAAVERSPDDPRRPARPRSHDAFWRGRGYAPRPGLALELEWSEPGRGPCAHTLQVWLRALEPA